MSNAVEIITAKPFAGRVTITFKGNVLADSDKAVLVSEYGHAPTYYIPREDIDMTQLTLSEKETLCPHKGITNYWSHAECENIALCYETPISTIAIIAAHLTFDPYLIDEISVMCR